MKKIALLLFLFLAANAIGQTEKRLALVVGNSEYLGKGNSLANPAHDAEDVSAKLKTLGFDVTTLIDGSLLQMKDAINLFSSKAKDYDIAFFYYSGHGLQTKGSNYMMPVDAEPSTAADIEYECYPLNRLLDKLDESNCPMKIIVLDACRNNPFTKGWYRGSAEEGLASVQSPKGTFITFATAAGSVAYDGTGRNSPYTTAFLQTLDTPNLSLFEFFNTVGQLVLEETQNKQDPWVNYSTMKGNFCFNNITTNAMVQDQAPSLTSPASPTNVKSKTLTFTANGVSFVMRQVEGGTFWMGAQSSDPNWQNYDSEAGWMEGPVHCVKLNTFYLGETEVTQALWEAIMGTTVRQQRDKYNLSWPLFGEGDNYPIYDVSWNECQEFVQKLNQLTGQSFRLPTEAEWEYAARGGLNSKGYKYAGSNTIKEVAHTRSIENGTHKPVKTLSPNELGLYDMSGNVGEWCYDLCGNDFYKDSPYANPQGPSSGSYGEMRILRGSGFTDSWGFDGCRVSDRDASLPNYGNHETGFRLALSDITSKQNAQAYNGVFSVAPNRKVRFAPSNLQYLASSNSWRLAPNPWDVIGKEDESISQTYRGWIDLFGWGTGNDPTKRSKNNEDYSSFIDWGSKYGSGWRTLTKEEWIHVLKYRTTTSNIRYVFAKVNDVNGLILLPDDWNSSIYNLSNPNINSSFSCNIITIWTWNTVFSPAGAVFLPTTGKSGDYWSASSDSPTGANGMGFSDNFLYSGGDSFYRFARRSVRLVHPE